jgi:predicted lysophospholipase L1 biosynthesis ABC-type transport system permease subunit
MQDLTPIATLRAAQSLALSFRTTLRPVWVRNHLLRRLTFVALFVALAVVLLWFEPLLASVVILGVVGALLVTAEARFLTNIGRNSYDTTPEQPRSGPWEGPR